MKDQDIIICRCEEVSEKEILRAIDGEARTLQDIKRITRATMGLCQGRTCRKLISDLLHKSGKGLNKEYPRPPMFRLPVRPIKLRQLADKKEEENESDA